MARARVHEGSERCTERMKAHLMQSPRLVISTIHDALTADEGKFRHAAGISEFERGMPEPSASRLEELRTTRACFALTPWPMQD